VTAAVWPGSALIIVPTYCEKDNVGALTAGLMGSCPSADLLFVDDDSPDGTGRIIDELASRHDHVHVLHRPGKAGLGRAYVAGFRWALDRGYVRIVAMDADLSHDPDDVPRLLAEAERADLVLGSRYLRGGRVAHWGLAREMLSRAAGFYVRAITGLPFSDPTGGFKCYRSEVIRSLDLGCIVSNGFAFQVEMTHKVWQAGFRVVDIPIAFRDRQAGRSKISLAIAFEGAWRVWSLLGRVGFRRRPAVSHVAEVVQGPAAAGRAGENLPSE